AAYSASKAALHTLTECLAMELEPKAIKINCLALGSAQTEMLANAFPQYESPVTAQEMGSYIAQFALGGHRVFNGKVLPVAVTTPQHWSMMILIENIHLTKALRLGLTVSALITLSCQNESRHNASEALQEDPASEIAADMGAPLPALPYIAVFDDESEQLQAQKNPDFDRTSLTLDALTLALRTNYPEIGLEVDRISNDTLFVRIADASYLTQQMGSSGAQVYIMETTYAY